MGGYGRALIHYFSGTGNALQASRWLVEEAERGGVPATLVNLEGREGPGAPAVPAAPGRTLLGFCFPTHGFAPPWLVLKALWRFPRVADADVFFLNTRAGVRLPGFMLPGLSGVAQWFPILLFALRGYRVVGSLPLDMPHSWISFFPPNPKSGITRLLARCRRIVGDLAARLLSGRRYFRWSVWLTLPLDLALLPITIVYVAYGRFFLAKTLFTSSSCSACGLCAKHCPVQAIEMIGDRPYWKYTCESCMRCMNLCPKRSIQSWVTRLAALIWGLMALGLWLYPMNGYLWMLIVSVLFFPLYRLLHLAWGSRFVNALFTYSSLTRYWKRYLAPGLKAKDFPPRGRGAARAPAE